MLQYTHMETNKKLLFENEARQRIMDGVEKLARAVRVTLGPRGRNVVIERIGQSPHITKDGVTVARSINLKDQFANIGAQMLKEVASQTVDVAGDGTTTATILAHAIYKEGLKLIAAGHKPTDLKKGIDIAVKLVTDELVKNSIKVGSNKDILHIGTVSANGDETVGKMLAEAMERVGNDGVITVEEAKGYNTTLEVVEGMQFNRGYTSPFFVTNNEKLTAELENPYILITNKKYDTMKELLPILEPIAKSKRPVLIIVDDIDGEALNALTVNKMKGVLSVCAIRGPEFGSARHSMLEDIAILTGGQIVSDASGIKESDININDAGQSILGLADKVIVGKGTTTIVAKKDRKEAVEKRVEEIKKHLEDTSISEEEEKLLRRRLSRLSGGVAIIRVGGATEVEMRERKDRVDDALCATQAAVEAGIVPGGGTALVHASKVLNDPEQKEDFNIRYGIKIIKAACTAPLMQIVRNAGASPDVVLDQVIKEPNSSGWDASTEKFCNLIKAGIIDPVKVPKTALENAASVASLLLTIDCAIAEDDPDTLRRLVEQMQ